MVYKLEFNEVVILKKPISDWRPMVGIKYV